MPALRYAAPVAASALSAVAFLVAQVPVGDLWAARARESATASGAGLDYWFGWYGGATPPGAYSVLSPYLSVLVGTATLAAIATVATTALVAVAVDGAPNPAAATWTAAVVGGLDLWCGRVAFAVGTAFAAAAVLAVRKDHRWVAAAAGPLAALSSPVVAVLLVIGLSGVLLLIPARRVAAGTAAAAAALVLVGLGVLFGSPGAQPMDPADVRKLVLALVVMLLARPARYVTVPIVVSIVAYAVLATVPNAIGSNFHRMVWVWLPVAVVATARRTLPVSVACIGIAVATAVANTVTDLRIAVSPAAATAQYAPLVEEIEGLRGINAYRLEAVIDGTHDAAYLLLDHATLARGYETQADIRLDAVLWRSSLDAASYRRWLDDNAVGFVLLHRSVPYASYESRLVARGLPYLRPIWTNPNWVLYRVRHAVPIVGEPGRAIDADQAQLTLATSRPGPVAIRVRWSRALEVAGPPGAPARLAPAAGGWTRLWAGRAGRYVLSS